MNKVKLKRNQWLWFIGLWCAGLGCILIIAKIIKLVMNASLG